MKKSGMTLLLVFIVLTFFGCATMPGPNELVTKPSIFPKPTGDNSLVYFYREKSFFGAAASYYIYEGEQKIGALESGNYFYHFTNPGKHTYWAKTEVKELITINCEAGKIYFIEGGVGVGILIGNPKLTEVTAQHGENAIKDLKYRPLVDSVQLGIL